MTIITPEAGRPSRVGAVASVVVALVLGATASVFVAAPAQAACGPEGVHVGDPYKSGTNARAMSFMDNVCAPSQYATVILQRKGFGWVDLVWDTVTRDRSPNLSWNCSGSTHTYRQIAIFTNVGGQGKVIPSREVRFSC